MRLGTISFNRDHEIFTTKNLRKIHPIRDLANLPCYSADLVL